MDLKRRKTKLMHDAAWLPRLTSLSRELAPLTHPQSVSQQLCRDQHNPKRQPSSSQPGMFDHEVSATEERATSSASEPQRGASPSSQITSAETMIRCDMFVSRTRWQDKPEQAIDGKR